MATGRQGIDVLFAGNNGFEQHMGSLSVRARAEVRGSKSSFRVGGGAVALIMELMSDFPSRLRKALLSSYRSGKSVGVVRYGRAFSSIQGVSGGVRS